MLQIVLMAALVLLLTTSCMPVDRPSASISNNSSPEEAVNMPEESLPPELQQVILKAIGSEKNVSPDSLRVVNSEAVDWPDACLGLSGPDEFCAQMITPGWAVRVTDGQQSWQYRTDLDGIQVKQATSD
ncbi:MAG: hypothetical protein F6K65_40575 [Moorea sp. SIO3C2]|nr:hypothetical protein [Moorena sp. SIO3C2]